MQEKPWFIDWFNSPYYHQLYFKRDEKEAFTFINNLLDHLKPLPGARMLDVACGQGRHAFCLASRGFDVTGFDLSEESIKIALKYQSENLHFYLHDMRMPFWMNYFDYAFNFFTSFGYFVTRREHDNALRTIAQSLKTNGVFVFDYLNTKYAEDHFVPDSTKDIDGTHYTISKWQTPDHFYKKIIIEDEKLKQPLLFTEVVHKFSLHDLKEMFARQNLHIKEIFGNYELECYDAIKSPRLIIVAEKKIANMRQG